jgi:hypothetical protein
MKYAFSFVAVLALVVIAWLGSMIPGLQYLFGVAIPYLAIMIFLGGFIYRVVQWAKSPVPFSIPTTCGQGKSLDFIKQDKLDCPTKTSEVAARMLLEIFAFGIPSPNSMRVLKSPMSHPDGSGLLHCCFTTLFW